MEDDVEEDRGTRFREQTVFLQEVKDRAKAVSRNARGTANDVMQAVKDGDEEGDEEMQSYLIKIRAADTSEGNEDVPQIVIEESEKLETTPDALEVQVSSVKLNLSAEYAKMGLAQKGRRRRKPKIRWTLREDVFEGVAVQQDAVSDDESMREEKSPGLMAPAGDKKRYSAPVFSSSLMSDLGNALSKKKARPEIDSSNESLNEECSKVPLGMPIAFKVAVGPKQILNKPTEVSSASLVKTAAALKKTEVTREAKEPDAENQSAPWMKEFGKRKQDRDGKTPPPVKQTKSTQQDVKQTGDEEGKGALPFQVKLSTKVRVTSRKEPEPMEQEPPWKDALRKRATEPPKNEALRKQDHANESVETKGEFDEEHQVSPWAGMLKPAKKSMTSSNHDTELQNGNLSISVTGDPDRDTGKSDSSDKKDIPEWKRYLEAKRELKERKDSRESTHSVVVGHVTSTDQQSPRGERKSSISTMISSRITTQDNQESNFLVFGIKREEEEDKNAKNVRLSSSEKNLERETSPRLRRRGVEESFASKSEIDIRSKDLHRKTSKDEAESLTSRHEGGSGSPITVFSKSSAEPSNGNSSKPAWMKDLRKRREVYANRAGSESLGSEDGRNSDELMGHLRRRRKKVLDAEKEAFQRSSSSFDTDGASSPTKDSSSMDVTTPQVNTQSRNFEQNVREPQSPRLAQIFLREQPAVTERPRQSTDSSSERTGSQSASNATRDRLPVADSKGKEYQRKADQPVRGSMETNKGLGDAKLGENKQNTASTTNQDQLDGKITPLDKKGRISQQTDVTIKQGPDRPTVIRINSIDDSNLAKTDLRAHDVRRSRQDSGDVAKAGRPNSKPAVPPKTTTTIRSRASGSSNIENSRGKLTTTGARKVSVEEKSSPEPSKLDVHNLESRGMSSISERERKAQTSRGRSSDESSLKTESKDSVNLSSEDTSVSDVSRPRRERRERRSPNRGSEDSIPLTSSEGNKPTRQTRRVPEDTEEDNVDKARRSPLRERRERGERRQFEEENRAKSSLQDTGPSRLEPKTSSDFVESARVTKRDERNASPSETIIESPRRRDRRVGDGEKTTNRDLSANEGKDIITSMERQLTTDLRSRDQRKAGKEVDRRSSPDQPSTPIATDMKTRLKNGGDEKVTPRVQEQISSVSGFRSRVQHARNIAERLDKKTDNKVYIRRDLVTNAKPRDDARMKITTETRNEDKPEWLRLRKTKIKEATRKLEPGQGDWV